MAMAFNLEDEGWIEGGKESGEIPSEKSRETLKNRCCIQNPLEIKRKSLKNRKS
jgi:hypothetical protein